MSGNELNKTNIWKNFIGLLVLSSIISLAFVFNINVGFSVFDGLKVISLTIFTIIMIIIIIIIISVILAFLFIIHNLNKENEEMNDE